MTSLTSSTLPRRVRKETQTPADELAASRTARAAVFIRNDPARPTQTGELVGYAACAEGETVHDDRTTDPAVSWRGNGVCRKRGTTHSAMSPRTGKRLRVADNSYLDSDAAYQRVCTAQTESVITSKYGRHKLASDGTRFGPGQAIVTPAVIKGTAGNLPSA